jgi:Spy/CpxP family protein refolding chaperone
MLQRQVQHLTQSLSLTTAQQAQATTLFTAAQTANEASIASLRAAHKSLATAVKNNDLQTITTVTAQIGTLTGQMTANTAKAEAAFYQTLTPDQQAKYTPSTGFGGFAGRMGGGPGGRPRGPVQQ